MPKGALIFLAALALCSAGVALAQSIGGGSGISVTTAATTSGGGGGTIGCTNQLVLDYSNSCALIGQGWGE